MTWRSDSSNVCSVSRISYLVNEKKNLIIIEFSGISRVIISHSKAN